MNLKVQLVERPTSQTKTALEAVNELTYSIFKEKGFSKELALNILKSLGNCYNFYILGESDENDYDYYAEKLLNDYKDALIALKNMKNIRHLEKTKKTLETWFTGINNVYKETQNMDLYIDGQMKMFSAIFRRFNQSLTNLLISNQQEAISDVLLAEKVDSIAA